MGFRVSDSSPSFFFAVVKGDDIRRTFVLKKVPIDFRHLWRANNVNAEIEIFDPQQFAQQLARHPAQIADIDGKRALLIFDEQARAQAWGFP